MPLAIRPSALITPTSPRITWASAAARETSATGSKSGFPLLQKPPEMTNVISYQDNPLEFLIYPHFCTPSSRSSTPGRYRQCLHHREPRGSFYCTDSHGCCWCLLSQEAHQAGSFQWSPNNWARGHKLLAMPSPAAHHADWDEGPWAVWDSLAGSNEARRGGSQDIPAAR